MNSFDQVKIEQLPGKNNETGLNKSQLKDYFDERFFDDLKNNKVQIKQQWSLYIFEQNDPTSSKISETDKLVKKFYVDKKIFQEYLKEEQKKAEVSLDSDVLLKEFFETINTNKELGWLQTEVMLTKTDNLRDNPESLKSEVDNLLSWFEANKSRPRAPKWIENKHSKDRFEQIVKDDISSLKSIKRELKKYTYTTNMDYFASYIETMESHKEQLEKVRQIVTTWWNTAEIPAMLDSLKDVKKESLYQDIAAKYNVEYNKLIKNATLQKLRNKDMEWFQEYLEGVWSGDIEHPEQDKFYVKYKKDFEEILSIDPWLYWEITRKKQKNDNPNPMLCSEQYLSSQRARNDRYSAKPWAFDQVWNMFSDLVYRWNDPKKKEARTQAGKIWAIIWWVVLWFQLFKTLFTKSGKDKEGNRKWWEAALYWWGLLALFNFPKIANWTKTVFGKEQDKVEQWMGVTNSPEYQNYVKPPIVAMEAIWWIPIQTLIDQRIVVEKYGKLKLDYEKYKAHIQESNLSNKEKERLIKSMDKIKGDESLLTDWLWLLWINTIKQMESLAWNDQNKTLLDSPKMAEHFENITESPVNAMLANEWFKPKDSKAWYEITKDYDKDSSWNNKLIEWMKKWLIKLSNNKNYTLEKMMNNNKIDLTNKTIEWFKNNSGALIKFKTYEEMFDAVQLTDFIKSNFKWKSTVSPEPFHVNTLWNIEFDNTKWYEAWKNETNVVNANFYKNTLNNVSPTLWQQKENYVNYLNERWKREWKVSS